MKLSVIFTALSCSVVLGACANTLSQSETVSSSAADRTAAVTQPTDNAMSLMASASEVVRLCQATMPDSKSFQDGLKGKGYRFEGMVSGYRILSKDSRRLVAFATTAASRHTGCGVSFKNMTADQGVQLAQPWLQATQAEQIPLENTAMRAGVAWDGIFKGTAVRIAVLPDQDLGFMRGAMLLAAENK